MGILDEAIREHLELKRRHGAADSELKQLEDEAFGQAERPGDEAADPLAEAPTEFMEQPEAAEEESSRREPAIADLQEPPPPPETSPPDEEKRAIAEQPTELFDVGEELAEAPSPTDEELVEEEVAEPRITPADPLAELEGDEEAEVSIQGPAPDDDEDYEDEDDAFWSEQRLSDELDQALESPLEEDDLEGEDLADEQEPVAEAEAAEEPEPAKGREAPSSHRDEDVLEDTPDFLEETPEDDQLWFEQKPPKDFDFDD